MLIEERETLGLSHIIAKSNLSSGASIDIKLPRCRYSYIRSNRIYQLGHQPKCILANIYMAAIPQLRQHFIRQIVLLQVLLKPYRYHVTCQVIPPVEFNGCKLVTREVYAGHDSPVLVDGELQPSVDLILQEATANVEVKGMVTMLNVDCRSHCCGGIKLPGVAELEGADAKAFLYIVLGGCLEVKPLILVSEERHSEIDGGNYRACPYELNCLCTLPCVVELMIIFAECLHIDPYLEHVLLLMIQLYLIAKVDLNEPLALFDNLVLYLLSPSLLQVPRPQLLTELPELVGVHLKHLDAGDAEAVVDDARRRIGQVPVGLLHLHELLMALPTHRLVWVRVERQLPELALDLFGGGGRGQVKDAVVIYFFVKTIEFFLLRQCHQRSRRSSVEIEGKFICRGTNNAAISQGSNFERVVLHCPLSLVPLSYGIELLTSTSLLSLLIIYNYCLYLGKTPDSIITWIIGSEVISLGPKGVSATP